MSTAPRTLSMPADFMERHPERIEEWKKIIRNDPRRVIRVLGLSGVRDETIEGDTPFDSQYIIAQLRDISKNAKSDTWKALVNAGIVGALCKCALTAQFAVMHEDSANISQEEIKNVANESFSPYFFPLEIICNAVVSGAMPPTPTEKKTVEEMKKHWSSIMQRIWSEPAHSLSAEPKQFRVVERAVVPQMLARLVLFDPSFLDVIFKPADLTLAVVFRYWMHATAVADNRLNLGILLPLLDSPEGMPQHWRAHFERSPPPDMHALFPRIFLGASKVAGSDKKKRTPGQAADAVVSAAAAHFEMLPLDEVQFDYNFFHVLFKVSEKEHRTFNRAVFKSSKFWTANANVLRRAAENGTRLGEAVFMGALMTYSTMIHVVEDDGKEFVDALVYNWLSTGLFDALEASMDLLLKTPRGAMILTGIIAAIDRFFPQLSAKTRTALRSQLPRPRVIKKLLVPSAYSTDHQRQQLDRDYEDFVRNGMGAGPHNSMWVQGAWQMLVQIGHRIEEPGQCARRGCDKKCNEDGRREHICDLCKTAKYCSLSCLEKDMTEHRHICGWMGVIEQTRNQGSTGEHPAAPGSSHPSASPTGADKERQETPEISGLVLADLD